MPLRSVQMVRVLIGLSAFGVLSAAIGTVLALAMDGGGVPLSYLAGTPFHSFAVPGVILGGIVGGTQLAAGIALVRRARPALLLTSIAALGMLLWIFVELAIIQQYSWLQALYFGFGILELVLVLLLMGIAPQLVVPLHAAPAPPPRA